MSGAHFARPGRPAAPRPVRPDAPNGRVVMAQAVSLRTCGPAGGVVVQECGGEVVGKDALLGTSSPLETWAVLEPHRKMMMSRPEMTDSEVPVIEQALKYIPKLIQNPIES